MPASPTERLQLFATCAGRLSALEEHQRLFDGPASERTAARKRAFDDIIAAMIPAAVDYGMPRMQALAWQVDAKMAHAVLMQQATFGTDDIRRRNAAQTVEIRLSDCDGLLLGA